MSLKQDNKNQIKKEKTYTYVSVIYDDDIIAKTINEPTFYYRTELEEINIGDKVLVNRNGKDVVGIVIDVEYFNEDKVPYPIEKTKSIIKVLESPNNSTSIKCPNCGNKLIPIVYGLPRDFKKAKHGLEFLGGCTIYEDSPKYHCNNCRRGYTEDLQSYIDQPNNWFDEDEIENFEYHKISREDFQKIKEDDLMFITNPGRMGDEDGSTFIVKNEKTFKAYRVDGWMYPKEGEKVEITLGDATRQFPEWFKSWKFSDDENYKGKYKYLYMGFGNGISVDNSIYEKFEPYLNKQIEEHLNNSNELSADEKEAQKWSIIYNVWEDAFIEMVKDKGYKIS